MLMFPLAACADYLGDYRLEDVRLVEDIPPVATEGMKYQRASEYLRIELSSEASLYAAKTGPGLYADVDFCPLKNPDRMIAFGPIATDEKVVESWKRDDVLKPNPHDQRYHYFVYVVPSSPPRKIFANSEDETAGYELRKQMQDVCVRFFVPGYNIMASRSNTVEIPANAIEGAFRRATPKS
jgi:hypothetical protein